MSVSKAAVAIYCAAVLGLQAWVIGTTSGYNDYFWPFVNYPMYSRSFPMGQQIRHARLMLQPCDRSLPPGEMTFRDAHLIRFVFQNRVYRSASVLRNTTPDGARRAAASLTQLAHRHVGDPTCRIDVWVQLYRVGRDGLELPGTPWIPYFGWNVRDGVITDSALATPAGPP